MVETELKEPTSHPDEQLIEKYITYGENSANDFKNPGHAAIYKDSID